MSVINDPSMKEIVDDFCVEALKLFSELENVLSRLDEDPSTASDYEEFGQIIDRVMGAAKSIGADEIGNFCELGKIIGYKASQVQDLPLLNVVVAILYDSVDLLKRMTTKLQTGNEGSLEELNTKAFSTRLHWLSEKFKSIDRASVAVEKSDISQADIDKLLNDLGL